MKRKLKKEVKVVILLMLMLLITILITTSVFTKKIINESDSLNNTIDNNVNENIAQKEDDDDVIKVIIDEPQNEKNTENDNQNSEENVDNQDNNNKDNKDNKDDKLSKDTYYIKVNNKANVVTIYKKDSKGKYTVPVKAMLCSIGTATPKSGVYKTSDKYTWRLLQGNVYGQYAVRITGHILFHSVPYEKQAKDTLEWWEYDKLGTDASLGCVRLTVEDAKWIYDNCAKGTQVEFYSSSEPGPLGKPIAKKISSYDEELKNWDPTDPDSKNPWNTYVEASTEPEDLEEGITSNNSQYTENNKNNVYTNGALNNV